MAILRYLSCEIPMPFLSLFSLKGTGTDKLTNHYTNATYLDRFWSCPSRSSSPLHFHPHSIRRRTGPSGALTLPYITYGRTEHEINLLDFLDLPALICFAFTYHQSFPPIHSSIYSLAERLAGWLPYLSAHSVYTARPVGNLARAVRSLFLPVLTFLTRQNPPAVCLITESNLISCAQAVITKPRL